MVLHIQVKETVEVADIMQTISEYLVRPTQCASASSALPNLGWIPEENVRIAEKAKRQQKVRRKQVKAISDNADPVFPKAQSHSQSRSWPKLPPSKSASALHKGKSPKKGAANRVGEGQVSVPRTSSDT